MATITGFTAEHMQEIENTTIVDGDVVGDNLILHPRNAADINAGNVRGPKGDTGNTGATGAQGATGPQGPKGDTGDVGEMVAHSEAVGSASGTGETTVCSFTIPSGLQIGDRIRLLFFGSLGNMNNQYPSLMTMRCKIAGSTVGTITYLVGSMADGRKFMFDSDWTFFQEDSDSSLVKGFLFINQAPSNTVESGSDSTTTAYAPYEAGVLANPVVTLGNKVVTITVQNSYAEGVTRVRGFHVEHHHIAT